jgi:hypothetical protein
MKAKIRADSETRLNCDPALDFILIFVLQIFCKYWPCDQYMSTISTWVTTRRKSLFFQNLQCQINATTGSHASTSQVEGLVEMQPPL